MVDIFLYVLAGVAALGVMALLFTGVMLLIQGVLTLFMLIAGIIAAPFYLMVRLFRALRGGHGDLAEEMRTVVATGEDETRAGLARNSRAQTAKKLAERSPIPGPNIPAEIVYLGGSEPGEERTILINRMYRVVDADTGRRIAMIEAYCTKRRAERTFRVDRIDWIFDPIDQKMVFEHAEEWIEEKLRPHAKEEWSKVKEAARENPPQMPVGGARIPALIVYNRGIAAGERREVLINSMYASADPNTDQSTMNIKAICVASGSELTFRVDRILELIDAETGELAQEPLMWLTERLAEHKRQRRLEGARKGAATRAAYRIRPDKGS